MVGSQSLEDSKPGRKLSSGVVYLCVPIGKHTAAGLHVLQPG